VQEALRAVVGRVLGQVEASGSVLPGNHHFYITFKTGAPGVSIPDRLRERFPDDDDRPAEQVLGSERHRHRVYRRPVVQPDSRDAGHSLQRDHAFVDPAVDFGLQFQAIGDLDDELHEAAENDVPESPVTTADDGSNVVTVDFGRKK
jgi:hypothetical protein